MGNQTHTEGYPGRHTELASRSTLTFDLQLALHQSLSQVVDGLAGVHATIIGAGLPDLQGTYSLVAKHAVARVVEDGYLVLHPDHFGLQSENRNVSSKYKIIITIRNDGQNYKKSIDPSHPQLVYLPYLYIHHFTIGSPTYPWVGTDTTVKSSVVAGDGKSVDQRLCELWRLLEVVVAEIVRFDLHACWGKGKGMGLCMILALSGIMWEIP